MGSDEDREDDYFEAGMQVLGKMERFGHFHVPVSDGTILFMHIYLNVYRYTYYLSMSQYVYL